MNPALFKTLLATVPVAMLAIGSILNLLRKRNLGAVLQLIGAACLTIVLVTHFFEPFRLLTWMQWGQEHSAGHYLDLCSAILGLAFFPAGYFLKDRPYNRNMTREKVQKEIDDAQKFGEQLEAIVFGKKIS